MLICFSESSKMMTDRKRYERVPQLHQAGVLETAKFFALIVLLLTDNAGIIFGKLQAFSAVVPQSARRNTNRSNIFYKAFDKLHHFKSMTTFSYVQPFKHIPGYPTMYNNLLYKRPNTCDKKFMLAINSSIYPKRRSKIFKICASNEESSHVLNTDSDDSAFLEKARNESLPLHSLFPYTKDEVRDVAPLQLSQILPPNFINLTMPVLPDSMVRFFKSFNTYLKRIRHYSPIIDELIQVIIQKPLEATERLQCLQAPGVLDLTPTDIYYMVRRNIKLILRPQGVTEAATFLLNFSNNANVSNAWTREDVAAMLCQYPILASRNVTHLENRFFALQELGLTREEILRIGIHSPGVFCIGSAKTRMQQLCKTGWFTEADTKLMLKSWPKILTFNVERTVKPKMLYLVNHMFKPSSEVLAFPQYLSYSLRRRIIPRHVALLNKHSKEKGVYNPHNSYGVPNRDVALPNLKILLASSDASFMETFNISYADFVEAKLDAEKVPNPQQIF